MNTVESILKLTEQSEMAKRLAKEKSFKLITVGSRSKGYDGLLTFHPNGKTGCIEMNDDYIFGIRCDHMIWVEGWCEDQEPFITEWGQECIMLLANHKGDFYTLILTK